MDSPNQSQNKMPIFADISPTVAAQRPFIIAEIGVNHGGDMNLAKKLIDLAKEGGADAVKFQTYRADTLAAKKSPAYWDMTKEPTPSQHELFKKYDRFWKPEFEELARHCESIGIIFFSTPFDIESSNFLNDLMPFFKVSSSDLTNRPFIEHMAQFGKPIILSTGASFEWEIAESLSWIKPFKVQTALLHCVLNYPTHDENANLGAIQYLQARFPEHVIGYSDHMPPGDMIGVLQAIILGAKIIEKHFTHDKTLPGNDHYHAMDKNDLRRLNELIDLALLRQGPSNLDNLDSQTTSRENARRSLVSARNIKKGQTITLEDLTFKRPASGISPKFINEVVGSIAASEIPEDTIILWNHLGDCTDA
jgi:sialic acid synthase SpsE